MKRFMSGVLLAAAAALAGVAVAPGRALGEDSGRDGPSGTVGAQYRAWTTTVSEFEASPGPDTSWEPGTLVTQRLRVHASGKWAFIEGFLEGDAFHGTLYGTYPELSAGAVQEAPEGVLGRDAFVPRKAYVEITTPVALLRLGHQTSQWGLGLLANSGEEDPRDLFGQKTCGDIVERALVATKPFLPFTDGFLKDVILAGGVDLVYRDENAYLLDDDRAMQFLGTLVYKTETTEAGGYVVYRSQEDAGGSTLDVLAVDIAAKTALDLWDQGVLHAAFEAALLTGETDRTKPYNSPDGADVSALAAAARVALEMKGLAMRFGVEAGYASGDADLDDPEVSRFRLDPDYNVGLILFDHYLYGLSASAPPRATDPAHAAVPPEGLDNLVTGGSVENACWVAPSLVWGDTLGPAAGVLALFAWSPSAVASPYETFAAGGAPHGYLGAATHPGDMLGIEVDASARYRERVADTITLEAKVESGVLLPGAAFDNADGTTADAVTLVQGRIAVEW